MSLGEGSGFEGAPTAGAREAEGDRSADREDFLDEAGFFEVGAPAGWGGISSWAVSLGGCRAASLEAVVKCCREDSERVIWRAADLEERSGNAWTAGRAYTEVSLFFSSATLPEGFAEVDLADFVL